MGHTQRGVSTNFVTTIDNMKSFFHIFSVILLCLFNNSVCWAQKDEPSYDLDDVMREILDTRIEILIDTTYFNQQLPYFEKFYDLLNDSVKLELLEKSTEIWHKEGVIENQDSIKGEKLNFYIKIALYFQYFYENNHKITIQERWAKNIGDSLHFFFYVDNNIISSKKYKLYCLTIRKDNNKTAVLTSNKGCSSIKIQTDGFPVDCIVIVKYKHKYIPADRLVLHNNHGFLFYCNLYTKKMLPMVCNPDLSDSEIIGLDAFVRTTVEYQGPGIETKIPIQNLRKISKENKRLISLELRNVDSQRDNKAKKEKKAEAVF